MKLAAAKGMMKPQTFMVIDVESIGLHGEAFSVGYVVMEDGREVESGYYFCNPELAVGTGPDRELVQVNVVPVMGEYVRSTYGCGLGLKSPREVREVFWERWMGWKANGAVLAADCPWPVEARFLMECVGDDRVGRDWQGPYPLIDVASVRLAAGLDPLGTDSRQEDETPVHHPTADARQSARLLMEALAASVSA
jgi:hypothetical protein